MPGRSIRMLALAVLCVVGLAACGATSNKPLTAAEILKKGTDAAMALKSTEFTMDIKVTVAGQVIPATGSGKLTTNPNRSTFSFSLAISGQSITIDEIQDGNDIYTKDPTSGMWTKTTSTDDELNVTDFATMQNPTLVGTETVNGAQTYHIKGTDKDGNMQEDWFRTDNFYPAKTTIAVAGDTPTTGTVTFTKWNENLTIDLPPADQIVQG